MVKSIIDNKNEINYSISDDMKINQTKKVIRKAACFLFTLTFLLSAKAQQTADTLANLKTKCILQYMSGLSSQPDNKVISGQWMNHRPTPETPQTEFDTSITSIYNQTSKWVGIIGTDYMRDFTMPFHQAIKNISPVNQPLIDYSNQNGLVSIMVSWKNPWTGGNKNDMTNSSNLLDIVTPSHPANTFFLKELDSIAVGLQQLQDSNVTVLFRPFHEMNAPWFWWGIKSSSLPLASDFASLWQYTFNYLTSVKNLHNILWYYTPSAKETGSGIQTELFYYPGNNYVDVIGLDIYNDTLDISATGYSALIATGKPIGIAEFGPKNSTVLNQKFVYDYTILINQIKNKYPALCHWISWNHFKNDTNWTYYSLSTQNNTSLLLNDSWVVNRDEIDYSACLTLSIDEQNISEPSILLFPNPLSTQATVQTNYILKNATLTIYNYHGQTVKQIKNISGLTAVFSRDNLTNGLYFIRLTQDNRELITQKIIITD